MHGLLPLLLVAWLCLRLFETTNADDHNLMFPIKTQCSDNMNYTRGSEFQTNLDAILSSLPDAAAASSGFAENTTGGGAPDRAYGLAQCRGDVSAADCRSCLNHTAHEMASACPGQKNAMVIYEGCLLRYSNASFFGGPDSSDPIFQLPSINNVTQPERFMSLLGALMSNLTREAAYTSPRRFAAGEVQHTSFLTLYGLAQCTRDTSAANCNLCLTVLVGEIPKCCNGMQGGRIFAPICQLRFETYAFYDALAAQAAMSPAPAPRGGLVNGSDHSGSGSSRRTVRNTAVLVSVPVLTLLLLFLLLAVYVCKKRRTTNKRYGDDEEMRSSETLQYDLGALRAATNNFSEENLLGKGGFGPVYKGTMQNGQEIAVKRLSTISQQGLVEMKNEIVLVAKLQHKNLVRLLGFCIDEEEKLIVYEFLSNKSLNKILFDPATQEQLSWDRRYKIIEGISRGLLYLHEDSRLTIIHRDLKPGNILLDTDMNPKISDFGLAKLFKIESSVENTRHIAGTYGYMAPEYAYRGIFSTKSDVFSYGVLVLEIITGRRASDDLLGLVWKHWSLGSVLQLLDGYPAEEPGLQEMLRCIHIGLLCVQEDPQLRPRMASVLLMLRSRIVTMSSPAKPAFVVPIEKSAETKSSTNKVSVTDLEAR